MLMCLPGLQKCILCAFIYSTKVFTKANPVPGAMLVPGDLVLSKNTDQAPGLMEFPVGRRKQTRKILELQFVF